MMKKWLKKILDKHVKKLVEKKIAKKVSKKSNGEKFRLNGKHLFLTYPQIEIEREDVLNQLKRKLEPYRIINYVISTEGHREGGNHVHVYLGLDRRCDIQHKDRLDLKAASGEKHGNYQSCRSYMSVVSYIAKGDRSEILTNMDLDEKGRVKNSWKEIYDDIKEGMKVEEVLEKIGGIAPRLMVTEFPKVKKSVLELKRSKQVIPEQIYSLDSFDKIPEIENYKRHMESKTLYLSGDSGIGKTEFMKAFYSGLEGEGKVLRITDREGLARLKEVEVKAFILDDVNFEGLSGEQIINLVDLKNGGTFRILYGIVDIPVGVPRAIISNKKIREMFGHFHEKQLEAVLRRCFNVDLKGRKLRIKVEIEVEETK